MSLSHFNCHGNIVWNTKDFRADHSDKTIPPIARIVAYESLLMHLPKQVLDDRLLARSKGK